jgi:hypothetical protein
MRRALGELAANGAALVRWWLLGDGRAGLREDGEGRILGLDDRVFADLDAAVEGLREAGLRALFVSSTSSGSTRPVVNGCAWGAARHVRARAASPPRQSVFPSPSATARARHRRLDPMNEPEWATLAVGTLDPRRSVSRREMRAFLGETASAFRSRVTQPLSVGLASARWLSLLDGLPLDHHQVHWYEGLDPLTTLARPVETLALGRPLLLGEFPTRGSSLPPRSILEMARAAGYSGALAWSALAEDRASDAGACHDAIRGFRTPPAARTA